jgi:hypothetical protein
MTQSLLGIGFQLMQQAMEFFEPERVQGLRDAGSACRRPILQSIDPGPMLSGMGQAAQHRGQAGRQQPVDSVQRPSQRRSARFARGGRQFGRRFGSDFLRGVAEQLAWIQRRIQLH